MKKLSIITVCLNAPKLELTCESIVNQMFQDFEWIVIDGGSNGETLAIFEKYKYRMDYFVSEPDGGIYYGMNKGMRHACGEWVNFMNAGDMFIVKNVLQKIFYDSDAPEDADVLYGKEYVEGKRIMIHPDTITKQFLYKQTLRHQSTFIRRTRCIPYDTSYRYAADWKFFINLYNAGAKFKRLERVVSVFDGDGVSRRNSESPQRLEELSRVQEECFSEEERTLLEMHIADAKEAKMSALWIQPRVKF